MAEEPVSTQLGHIRQLEPELIQPGSFPAAGTVVGVLAVRYAIAMGARVAVTGRSNRAEAAVRELGAEVFFATRDSDPAEALTAWGGGAVLIVNTSPSTAAEGPQPAACHGQSVRPPTGHA